MYISIQAGITDITLESLDGYKIYTKNNTKISGLDGWYLLTTSNIQINDILINNESIGDLIHTGYIKNNSFHIWIHTNLGCMISCCRKDINSDDFNKELYNNYMLTVDRPITLSKLYSESINSFFKNANGPHWWKDNPPYKIFTTPTINKDEMLHNFESQLKYNNNVELGWSFQTLKPRADLPLINFNKIDNNDRPVKRHKIKDTKSGRYRRSDDETSFLVSLLQYIAENNMTIKPNKCDTIKNTTSEKHGSKSLSFLTQTRIILFL